MYGKRLKELRESKNISQEMVAEELNISRQAISRWENDKAFPDIENLKLLSKLYEVSIDELVGVNEEKDFWHENKEKKNFKENEKPIFNNGINPALIIAIVVCSCFVFPIGIMISIIFLYKSKELKTKFWIWSVRLVCIIVLIYCIYSGYTLLTAKLWQGNATVEYLG